MFHKGEKDSIKVKCEWREACLRGTNGCPLVAVCLLLSSPFTPFLSTSCEDCLHLPPLSFPPKPRKGVRLPLCEFLQRIGTTAFAEHQQEVLSPPSASQLMGSSELLSPWPGLILCLRKLGAKSSLRIHYGKAQASYPTAAS